MKNRRFPIFVESEGKKVTVFGGGKIAARRIRTLCMFDFDIEVISPEILDEIKTLAEENKIRYICDVYREEYIDSQFMVLPCTDNREVNREIGIIAKEKGALVSVCDRKDECNFFFPAIAVNEDVTVGIAGSGNTHDITKKTAARVRRVIEERITDEG